MPGIDGHPAFPFRCGKYTLLLSRLDRHLPFTTRSIVEHGHVITRAFETHTVLPMRFGTFFQSEKQICRLVRENQKELLESFCRLRGKAEMRLKMTLSSLLGLAKDIKKPPQKTGSLQSDSGVVSEEPLDPQAHALAEQFAAKVRAVFQPLEQQVSCRMTSGSQLLVDCAHLIESQRVGTYQKLGETVSEQVTDCAIRMSGPWPPYHFLPASVRLPTVSALAVRARSVAGVR
jgi:hypothetical protein